jgi:adenine-specific DNA-methyltransferase
MSDSLRDLVLARIPEDGSAIGNGALIARLREIMPNLKDEDYAAAKDALLDEGILGKGKGRGGSVFLITEGDDNEDQDDDFELTPPRRPGARQPRPRHASRGNRRRSSAIATPTRG